MYGGDIINSGDPEEFRMQDFANSYQNEEATGKKLFVILWLHAFKYTYNDLTVETAKPSWAEESFVPQKLK